MKIKKRQLRSLILSEMRKGGPIPPQGMIGQGDQAPLEGSEPGFVTHKELDAALTQLYNQLKNDIERLRYVTRSRR